MFGEERADGDEKEKRRAVPVSILPLKLNKTFTFISFAVLIYRVKAVFLNNMAADLFATSLGVIIIETKDLAKQTMFSKHNVEWKTVQQLLSSFSMDAALFMRYASSTL